MAEKKKAPEAPKAKADPRVDAIIAVLKENGLSLEHHKELR